mgnify:CR=1 FL=1
MPVPALFRYYRCSCNYVALRRNTTSSILPRAKKKFQVRTELKVYCRDSSSLIRYRRRTYRNATCHCREGINGTRCYRTGKAGHAARNEGDNAIYKVLDDIAWFRDYRFEKESPLLGPVKMSVTVINAGTQHNVIPDKCTFISMSGVTSFTQMKNCLLKSKSIFPVNPKPVHSVSILHELTKSTHCTESYEVRTRSFWFSNIVRPGTNVLSISENRSGPFVTLTHGRRIYHVKRNRRSYWTYLELLDGLLI